MSIKVKTCSSAAHIPKRACNGSAEYDIWSAEKKVLRPWATKLFLIDLNITISEEYHGRIVGRCGIAKMYGISVHNGAIESDYRGNVGVILFNFSEKEYVAERGGCITQIIIERCYSPKFVLVREFTKEST